MAKTTRLLAAWALLSLPAVSYGQERNQGDWQERYDAQAVVFHSVSGREVAYQGESSEPLYGAQFYDAVGRSDLAAVYRGRERAKSGSLVLAILAAYASFPMVYAGYDLRIQSPDPGDRAIAVTGLALDVGAVVLATRAFYIHREPVSSAVRHRLADDYNDRLREELTGGSGEKAFRSPPPQGPRFSLAICPRSAGGEVLLGASF